MPFGDLISKAKGNVELVTADDQKVVVDSRLKKIGLKIFGLPHTEMRNRSRLILRNSKINPGDKILDAGCGIGLYGLEYAIKHNAKVVGVDLSKEKIKNAEKLRESLNAKNIVFMEGDLTKLKFKDESFDFILSSDVLEHIPNDEKALSELTRVLKKNGGLILTFPYNYEHSRKVMKKFGHVRPGYDEDMMRVLAEKNNLKIEKMTGYTYFFGKLAWTINEKTFKIPPLAAILFYPLYLLTYLDVIKIGKPNGLFVKLRKN
jgi:ubiquinone/menaquinone biosynthesis C-methylase UbiE